MSKKGYQCPNLYSPARDPDEEPWLPRYCHNGGLGDDSGQPGDSDNDHDNSDDRGQGHDKKQGFGSRGMETPHQMMNPIRCTMINNVIRSYPQLDGK